MILKKQLSSVGLTEDRSSENYYNKEWTIVFDNICQEISRYDEFNDELTHIANVSCFEELEDIIIRL